jgi:hypothetical protein
VIDGKNNIRSGICRGGPISGQYLHHHEDRFLMFKREGKLVTYTMPEGGPSELPKDTQVGAYEYDGDQWQWTREIE